MWNYLKNESLISKISCALHENVLGLTEKNNKGTTQWLNSYFRWCVSSVKYQTGKFEKGLWTMLPQLRQCSRRVFPSNSPLQNKTITNLTAATFAYANDDNRCYQLCFLKCNFRNRTSLVWPYSRERRALRCLIPFNIVLALQQSPLKWNGLIVTTEFGTLVNFLRRLNWETESKG